MRESSQSERQVGMRSPNTNHQCVYIMMIIYIYIKNRPSARTQPHGVTRYKKDEVSSRSKHR